MPPEFDSYLADLDWAQRFAWLNREEMMDRFATALSEFSGFFPVLSVAIIRPQEMSWTSVIDPFLIECLMKTLEQRDQVLVRGQVLVRVGVFALEVLEQDNDNQDND